MSSRSARRFSDLITDCGTVYVDLYRRKWYLHKKLLRQYSSYFRTKLEDNAVSQNLNIGGATDLLTSPEPFELFVQWLYTGTIDDISISPDSNHGTHLDIYIRLWCLCSSNHFDVPDLQDLAITRMEELFRVFRVSFSADHIRYIYTHTASSSVLRRHAIDAATHDLMVARPIATFEPPSSVDAPANTPRPSYTFRSTSHKRAQDFANNLLDSILRYTDSARAPRPFQPAPAPPSSPASPSSPRVFVTPVTHQSRPPVIVSANPPRTPESTPPRGQTTDTGSPRGRIRQRVNDTRRENPFRPANEAEPETEPESNPDADADAGIAPTT